MRGFGIRSAAKKSVFALQQAFFRGPIILCYHRVVDLEVDPQLLAVTPANFEEHLRVLKRDCWPMSLQSLFEELKKGEVPANAVAVTFDDGYFDNLICAKPLLEKYEVPATVFICTGYLEHQREFWWDQLERVFLTPGDLPSELVIQNGGSQPNEIQLGASAHYGREEASANSGWNVQMQSKPTPRQDAYLRCHGLLKDLAPELLNSALDSLRGQAGLPASPRPSHRPMSWQEVKDLESGGLIEIGGHTRWHPRLPSLPPADQAEDIMSGRQDLIERTGIVPASFSYPYGANHPDSVAAVQSAGFTRACCLEGGLMNRRTDSFRIPRVLARNWDGDKFRRILRLS